MIETLRKNCEFDNVYKNGRSYANKYLIMYVFENDRKRCRLGVSVSKRVGNSVIRHRVSRLIKESFRLNFDVFNSGLDIVVVARASARDKGYADINSAFLHLTKLHKIAKEKNQL